MIDNSKNFDSEVDSEVSSKKMTNSEAILVGYVETNVKGLVDFPEKVNITTASTTKAIIIQIDLEKSDRGKVIGKKGRTIDALKLIALAIKNTKLPDDKRKVMIEIIEN